MPKIFIRVLSDDNDFLFNYIIYYSFSILKKDKEISIFEITSIILYILLVVVYQSLK